jgi:hypothetical protein
MTSDRPGPPADAAWRLPNVNNDMSGTVHGSVIQSRDVTGDIHLHNYYAAAPVPPSPMPSLTPVRRRRRWPRVVGEWLLSFAPIFLVSVVPGGVGVGVAGDDSIGARLAGLVIGLAVVGVIGVVWWFVTRGRSRLSLVGFALMVMDRLAFKRLGTVGVPGLVVILVIFGGAVIAGLAQQPEVSATGGVEHPGIALVCCVLVVLVAVRRLRRLR